MRWNKRRLPIEPWQPQRAGRCRRYARARGAALAADADLQARRLLERLGYGA
jgi:hypothetical protein